MQVRHEDLTPATKFFCQELSGYVRHETALPNREPETSVFFILLFRPLSICVYIGLLTITIRFIATTLMGLYVGNAHIVAQNNVRPPALPVGSSFTNLTFRNVLTLTGNGNYLELPPSLFAGLNEATLDCGVKWHTFEGNHHFFEFDAAKRVKVGNAVDKPDLHFYASIQAAPTQTNAQPTSTQPGWICERVPD